MSMSVEKELKTKVSWRVFAWAIGIILLLFGVQFNLIANANVEVHGTNKDIVDIKLGIQELQTDVKWIKEKIK
jgi:hypothetical protein